MLNTIFLSICVILLLFFIGSIIYLVTLPEEIYMKSTVIYKLLGPGLIVFIVIFTALLLCEMFLPNFYQDRENRKIEMYKSGDVYIPYSYDSHQQWRIVYKSAGENTTKTINVNNVTVKYWDKDYAVESSPCMKIQGKIFHESSINNYVIYIPRSWKLIIPDEINLKNN